MEDLETPQEQPEAPPEEPAVVMEEAQADPPAADQAAASAGEAEEPAVAMEEAKPDPPAAEQAAAPAGGAEQPAVAVEEILPEPPVAEQPSLSAEETQLRAVLEAIVYVAEEPLTLAQLAASLQQPAERIRGLLDQLIAEFDRPEHGVTIREVAGGFKMATKPEHHDAVRSFVKSLKPPLKLSLPALETLAVIAYKQPVTGPEIQEIRGVQGAGVLKTLLDRKLIAVAGRKNVIGKPMLYKTTKEFLIQFGLKDLSELPSLKEFEEIRRMALSDEPPAGTEAAAEPQGVAEAEPVDGAAAAEPPAEAEPADEGTSGQPASTQSADLQHDEPSDG